MEELVQQIEKAYIQCESDVMNIQPEEIDVRIIRKYIAIIVKGAPTIEETIPSISIRGRNIHKTLCDMEREQFQSLLKEKLAKIIGCRVTSIQSDICIDSGEKLELIRFECDIESKFNHN